MKLETAIAAAAISLALLTTTGCAGDATANPSNSASTSGLSQTVLPILEAWTLVANHSMSQMLDTGVVETFTYPKETYTYVFDAQSTEDNPSGMVQQPGDIYNVVPESTYFLVVQASDFVTSNFTIDYVGTPEPNNFTVRVANLQQTEPAMFIDVKDGLIVSAKGGEGDTAYTGEIKYELTDADRQIVAQALALQ